VQIILNPPQTQLATFVDGTAFPSATVNQALDRGVQISLRLQDQLSRAIRGPDGDSNSTGWVLPPAAGRVNTALLFDNSGLPFVGAPVAQTLAIPQVPFYGVDSGSTNAYVITLSGSIALSFTSGALVRFTAGSANTGPSTANVAGLGVKSIVGVSGGALVGGELSSTGPNWIQWNGTAWQLAYPGVTSAQVAATYAPIASPHFTGDVTARGVGLAKYKASITNRSSNTTLTADPDLQVPLAASSVYKVEAFLQIQARNPGTQGFQFDFSYSGTLNSGALFNGLTYAQAFGIINGAAYTELRGGLWTVSPLTYATCGLGDYLQITGNVFTTTAGTLALQWAQNSSSASNTGICGGSYLIATPLN